MGLFYAVPLQATPATKNHQADYPLSTSYLLTIYMVNFKLSSWGWVVIIKLKANLSSNLTGTELGKSPRLGLH